MHVDLNLEVLTRSELVRFSSLLETLTEPTRSKAFNSFLFWTAKETDREIRGRRLRVRLRHVANVDVHQMRPGELLFLKRQISEWEWEFGKYVIGPLADVFRRASVELLGSQALAS